MTALNHNNIKHSFTTHVVPLNVMTDLLPLVDTPQVGNLVLAEIESIGKHTTLENRDRVLTYIFPGDQIIVAFGNRYATDQYEGYVPAQPVTECDLLSVGGVCGEVASRHASMGKPTRLRLLGAVGGQDGQQLNLRAFGMTPSAMPGNGEIILVVGASMNSGKTTTVGTLARALSQAGLKVAAAKVTGTAAGKDGRFFASCGAKPVFDFTDAGYPSTYMLSLDELMTIYHSLISQLRATNPAYILVEIADGIFQRETRMLLDNPSFRETVDHVFFAATDSLAAECGTRYLYDYGLPLRALSGVTTRSPLATREAEEATQLPCLSLERILDGEMLELLNRPQMLTIGRELPVLSAT
ncbi:MAG: hypothetical protein MI924_02125 [Chloroflexales bacterium]|nr:hypothetical protein [Chloroflexales bacterium]